MNRFAFGKISNHFEHRSCIGCYKEMKSSLVIHTQAYTLMMRKDVQNIEAVTNRPAFCIRQIWFWFKFVTGRLNLQYASIRSDNDLASNWWQVVNHDLRQWWLSLLMHIYIYVYMDLFSTLIGFHNLLHWRVYIIYIICIQMEWVCV